jgi:hypothetical protein
MRCIKGLFLAGFVLVSAQSVFAQQTFAQSAFAQQEKAVIKELPASAVTATVPVAQSSKESGVYALSVKKQVSLEEQKRYLKAHPEAAFVLPADTQERIKAGLPVHVQKINPDDLSIISSVTK